MILRDPLILSLWLVATPLLAAGKIDLAKKVFLGEVYPSGNVYLQSFSETDMVRYLTSDKGIAPTPLDPLDKWPAQVSLSPLNEKARKDAAVKDTPRNAERRGVVKKELSSKMKDGLKVITSEYIPAKEGMDTDHLKNCGLPYKRNEKLKYADDSDFFETVLDYCFFDDLVVHADKVVTTYILNHYFGPI